MTKVQERKPLAFYKQEYIDNIDKLPKVFTRLDVAALGNVDTTKFCKRCYYKLTTITKSSFGSVYAKDGYTKEDVHEAYARVEELLKSSKTTAYYDSLSNAAFLWKALFANVIDLDISDAKVPLAVSISKTPEPLHVKEDTAHSLFENFIRMRLCKQQKIKN